MARPLIRLITPRERERVFDTLDLEKLHQLKASIHGACVKLFTDDKDFARMWAANFDKMPEGVRPHGRIVALKKIIPALGGTGQGAGTARSGGSAQGRAPPSSDKKQTVVFYEPASKTAFLPSCHYYGRVKSMALGLVGDYLEDCPSEHKRFSIHGSCVEFRGKGVGLIGVSGSGKTTLTYGLLSAGNSRFLADDWFFVQMNAHVEAHASERNSYIRDDLGAAWPGFSKHLKGHLRDAHGRTIVSVEKVFGKSRVRRRTGLKMMVLLQRVPGQPAWRKLTSAQALRHMEAHDYCNPHQMVRAPAKLRLRKEFFRQLFERVPTYLLNTVETPAESLGHIIEAARAKR